MDLVEIVKALSHENRIRILNLLKQQELCVCELESILDVNQSNASRHLSKLKHERLINSKQRAQWVYYSINEDLFSEHIFLKNILDELDSLDICQGDNQRLKKYQASGLSCEELSENTLFN
ncbi:metalloregulator ArsR/SmtB family transcription factor [Iocasia frigidifontis]|uniref:Metalloregulator ArsR/SmtB family transcription factor n=1 Tax=Iocasia fonsfrigidae TaxID=2682810 RepID=A0A8A7K725_9FIRM|nr:metalloregulator ArsR/SmtB family transcription factor [Iocasia fonsfrigidae]QTL97583.1 metalloregulator ArsR/SmtB family transcription factor [Iocasia fonsfrigidae]